MVRPVEFLYSLYDALVSINVPNDKARAVVDAMERDMSTHLATKTDIDSHRLAMKGDIDAVRLALKADIDGQRLAMKGDVDAVRVAMTGEIDAVRVALKADIHAMKADIDAAKGDLGFLRRDVESGFALLRQEMQTDRAQLLGELALQRKDMDAMQARITIRLGSLIVVMTGLILTALQLR
jgi:hypothetical protein